MWLRSVFFSILSLDLNSPVELYTFVATLCYSKTNHEAPSLLMNMISINEIIFLLHIISMTALPKSYLISAGSLRHCPRIPDLQSMWSTFWRRGPQAPPAALWGRLLQEVSQRAGRCRQPVMPAMQRGLERLQHLPAPGGPRPWEWGNRGRWRQGKKGTTHCLKFCKYIPI